MSFTTRLLCFDADADGNCDQCGVPMDRSLRGRQCKTAMAERGRPAMDYHTAQVTATAKLGDVAQSFFESVGITKERYIAAKTELGLDPNCNCDERQAWLNAMGEKLGVNNVLTRLRDWRKTRKSARKSSAPPA